MKKQVCVFVVLLTMIFSIFNSANRIFPVVNATYVEDSITKDTVWTLVDSPFIISNNITVYSNATLTIEPGVEVRFGGAFSLTVTGRIYADGTTNPIEFTSNQMMPEEGDWNALIFNGIQKSTLINCHVKYASEGILVDNGYLDIINSFVTISRNGIGAFNGRLNVQNTTVSHCSQNGIAANYSETTVRNSMITENGENGIYVTGDGPTTIEFNTIMMNGNGILITGSTTSNVYINQNIISANTENGIQIDVTNHFGLNIVHNDVSSNGKGFYISTSTGLHITNNSVGPDNGIGILYDEGTHTANYNDIYGNAVGMGVESDASVDATHNYWGDKSGPYHEKLNPSGQGNSVGGDGVNLDFIFFLTKPIGVINTRPTAVFLTDRILVPPNGNVVFFATDSFDTDGRVDRYIFNFGDGYSSGLTTLSVFEHRYSALGTYYANLTVIDDYGTASYVVFETVNVQNLPPLQVNVDLSNSAVHEGEQVTVTVHATDGANAVENATIMMFSVTEGNFSQFSGLTDATGYFVTNFTAPDIADKTHFRIVARASKTAFTEGTAYKYLEVSPFLSVQVDANPNTIKSQGISQVTVYARSNGDPVIGASVVLSSTVGNLSSQVGVTNLNGVFSVVFTAPQTIVYLDSIITATVTKEGYMDGAGQVTIVIEPKILTVIVDAQPDVTISEANVTLTAHIEYEMIPIESANVTVTAQSGDFSRAYEYSNDYGNVTFLFTTPPVSTQSMITITVSASKTGYAVGQSTIELTINPRTFEIALEGLDVESEGMAAILVNVTCVEDGKQVIGANVTISSEAGSFNVTSMLTDGQGICDFVFAAPYTVVQIYVTVTANVTKNGYVDGGNQTQIVVNPRTVPPGEGGWPLMTILLILIPVIIAVVVIIVLIKFKVVTVSSKDMEEEA